MIEAVNSAVSNAQQARVVTEQVATLNSFAANEQVVESVSRGPVAPYISPFVAVDTNFDTAVIQFRDSETGDIINQFPSESALEARQRQAAAQEAQREEALRRETSVSASSTTFQASVIAQQASAPTQEGTSAGVAQAAIAALSAGAQSGQASSTTSVTA